MYPLVFDFVEMQCLWTVSDNRSSWCVGTWYVWRWSTSTSQQIVRCTAEIC